SPSTCRHGKGATVASDLRPASEAPARGRTPNEVARLLRKSPDWVRAEIKAGRLPAVNLGSSRRPQFIILPDGLAAFLRGRQAAPAPKTPRRRRRSEVLDFYPGD